VVNFEVMMNKFNANIVQTKCVCWIKELIIKQLHNELRDIPCWIPGKVEEFYTFLPTG
jgi:hypothetical protein